MPGPDCGTRRGYRGGCRCRDCRGSEARYYNRRQLAIMAGDWQPLTDATPVRRHVRTLQAVGLGYERIAELSGVSTAVVIHLLYGCTGKKRAKKIRTENAVKLLALRPRIDDVRDRVPVNGTGARRRLQALARIGFTNRYLGARIGMQPSHLGRLVGSGIGVTAANHRVIAKLYDELWDQDPVTCGVLYWVAAKTVRNAAARGWAPPAAWDDETIDDPAARPDLGEGGRRQDAIVEDAEFVASTMREPTTDKIAERLGVTRSYLEKAHERHRAELAQVA